MDFRYYIIKVTHKNTRTFKVGEYSNTNRPEDLVKKYESTFRDTKAIILSKDNILPHNSEKRLNDKVIHKKMLKSKIFVEFDGYLITSSDDGKDEFFRLNDNHSEMTDEDVIQCVAKFVEELGKNEDNFKGKIYRIKNNVLDYTGQTHLVGNYYINKIEKIAKLEEEIQSNILLIGQFDPQFIASLALYNNVTIWYDSKDELEKVKYIDILRQNITFITNLEDEKMCKKFNYIIANPPYGIGNELTKTVIENVSFDKYINLMPASKYKSKELYKYVTDIERVEDTFEDATIGDSLTLATLNRTAVGFESYDKLEMCKYDEYLKKYYKENFNRNLTFKLSPSDSTPDKAKSLYNPETDFYIYIRASINGVHENNDALDRRWNFQFEPKEKVIEEIIRTTEIKGTRIVGQFVYFQTKEEKNNFTEFWYNGGKQGLMHKLIKGLNKSSGVVNQAIPRVDWTRKWTDEEILKEYGYTEEEIKEIL